MLPVYKPKHMKHHASDRFYVKHITITFKIKAK